METALSTVDCLGDREVTMCRTTYDRGDVLERRTRSASPTERVGDADRERAASRLSDAYARGYLDDRELETRLAAAMSAQTQADLASLGRDLPREQPTRRSGRGARIGLQAHLASYVGVMALLVAIWLSVGLTAGSWYPWPVWPALGMGVGVVRHLLHWHGAPHQIR
ncbi:MAG: DUF1707 domain-containing protein [Propionibacteriales bacterium]|nr:DUF1707 domain-containing protein [Propionibacteriales bacterium]